MLRTDRVDARTRWLAGLMVASTLVLAAGFVGLLALVTGRVVGLGDRFPAYVLVMAVAFVLAVVGLTRYDADGRTVLAAATGAGVLALVLGTLAGEGAVYAAANPGDVAGSQLVVYFLAAGLVGTALSYWAVNYWREFAAVEPADPPTDAGDRHRS